VKDQAVRNKGVLSGINKSGLAVESSVAKVQFSPVLQPFLKNRELNRQPLHRTEPEPELNRIEPVLPVPFSSVLRFEPMN
jgi:hypothetical protein